MFFEEDINVIVDLWEEYINFDGDCHEKYQSSVDSIRAAFHLYRTKHVGLGLVFGHI